MAEHQKILLQTTPEFLEMKPGCMYCTVQGHPLQTVRIRSCRTKTVVVPMFHTTGSLMVQVTSLIMRLFSYGCCFYNYCISLRRSSATLPVSFCADIYTFHISQGSLCHLHAPGYLWRHYGQHHLHGRSRYI